MRFLDEHDNKLYEASTVFYIATILFIFGVAV